MNLSVWRKKILRKKGLGIWTAEIEDTGKGKQQICKKYFIGPTESCYETYKTLNTKLLTRRVDEESWNRFISSIEIDNRGRQ